MEKWQCGTDYQNENLPDSASDMVITKVCSRIVEIAASNIDLTGLALKIAKVVCASSSLVNVMGIIKRSCAKVNSSAADARIASSPRTTNVSLPSHQLVSDDYFSMYVFATTNCGAVSWGPLCNQHTVSSIVFVLPDGVTNLGVEKLAEVVEVAGLTTRLI